MNKALVAAMCLILGAGTAAQEKKQGAGSEAPRLEAKVRKVWEDFKNKNNEGVAAALADGFRELEEDGNGFGDSKAEVAMVDKFELSTYTLTDFTVKLLGNAALVNYNAEYEGKADGQPVKSKTAYGEVWVRKGNVWKVLYVQETNVK